MAYPPYDEIVKLAIRLGRRTCHPNWITYPTWVTPPRDPLGMMAVAAELRAQALRILQGEIPMPSWVTEEEAHEPPSPAAPVPGRLPVGGAPGQGGSDRRLYRQETLRRLWDGECVWISRAEQPCRESRWVVNAPARVPDEVSDLMAEEREEELEKLWERAVAKRASRRARPVVSSSRAARAAGASSGECTAEASGRNVHARHPATPTSTNASSSTTVTAEMAAIVKAASATPSSTTVTAAFPGTGKPETGHAVPVPRHRGESVALPPRGQERSLPSARPAVAASFTTSPAGTAAARAASAAPSSTTVNDAIPGTGKPETSHAVPVSRHRGAAVSLPPRGEERSSARPAGCRGVFSGATYPFQPLLFSSCGTHTYRASCVVGRIRPIPPCG